MAVFEVESWLVAEGKDKEHEEEMRRWLKWVNEHRELFPSGFWESVSAASQRSPFVGRGNRKFFDSASAAADGEKPRPRSPVARSLRSGNVRPTAFRNDRRRIAPSATLSFPHGPEAANSLCAQGRVDSLRFSRDSTVNNVSRLRFAFLNTRRKDSASSKRSSLLNRLSLKPF